MKIKRISQALALVLALFLLISCVNAAENVLADGSSPIESLNLADSDANEIMIEDSSADIDGNCDSAAVNESGPKDTSELAVSESGLKDTSELAVSESGLKDTSELAVNDSILKDTSEDKKLTEEEGVYVDATDAYKYLNQFRTEANVWYWNADDTTKAHVNTNDTIWLNPLERDPVLEETAKQRAKEISQYFSHYRPDGTWCFSLFPDDLLDYGENIAHSYPDCWAVTEGWKETNESYVDQGHRRTMLQASFNYVGIAGYKVGGVIYWVQNFGCRNDPKDVSSNATFGFGNNSANPKFSIELPKYASGTFSVKVDGIEIVQKSLANGKADFTVCGLAPGSHEVELSYLGDHNCNPVNRTATVTVAEGEEGDILSFNHLNTLIKMSGGDIVLEKSYAFDSKTDSDFIDGIRIYDCISIDGQSNVIDAKNQSRIFRIICDVTLKNLALVNGNANAGYELVQRKYMDDSSYGPASAYTVYGNVNVNGGAINADGYLTLVNCSFNGSTAYAGGAVSASNYVYAKDSSFSSNSAESNGGAIYSQWMVELENSTFAGNHAPDFGGAAYSLSDIVSRNSTFERNTNTQVFAKNEFTSLDDRFISDEYYDIFHNATKDNGIVRLDEDYTASQTIVINGSNVIIDGNGHKIDAKGKFRIFYVTGNNVTFRNIGLLNGYSINYGGAIYMDASGGIAVINSTLDSNRAELGGAIFANSSDISIIDSSLSNNEVLDISGQQDTRGGAICTDSGNVLVLNSNFTNNTALNGGAIHENTGKVTLQNSNFMNNDATIYGGGVLYTANDVDVINSTFGGNDALRYGGAIFAYEEAKVTVRNSSFTNNTSLHYGGAISAAVDLRIYNSSFSKNNATDHGGAISVWGEVIIDNSIFDDNFGHVGVFFIYCETSKVQIVSSQFLNNEVDLYAAVYATSNVFVRNSTFANNSALLDNGGGIFSFQNLTVDDSTFINNSVAGAGGALYSAGDNLIVRNSTFINNSAGRGEIDSYGSGGAIANYGKNLYAENLKFINNSALIGGAVFNSPNGNATVINSSFDNNSANRGGAIANDNYKFGEDGYDKAVFSVKNSEFNGNTAIYGGAAYNYNSTVKIDNSSLTDNKGSSGESIYDYSGSAYLAGSTLSNSDPVEYALVGHVDHANSKILEKGKEVTDEYVNYTRVKKSSENPNDNITDPSNPSGNGTGSGNSSGNGTNPTNSSGNGTNPSNPSGNGTNPGNSSGNGTNPSNPSGNGTNPGNSSGNATDNITKGRIGTRIIYSDMSQAPVPSNPGRTGNYFVVKLVDESYNILAGLPVKIGFNGRIYNKTTDSKGEARLQINLAYENVYTFAISFLGDDEYNASFEVAKISVKKGYAKPVKANGTTDAVNVTKAQKNTRTKTSIIYKNMFTKAVVKADGRAGENFTVRLVDKDGKALANFDIKIGFNGRIYNKTTDAKGYAKLQINLANKNAYTFAISYLGDDKYQASFEVAMIKVSPHIPKIKASAKTFKAKAKTKTVSATLLSANGNPISGKKIKFTLNGKTYSAKTNAKGVASVKVSLSKKGTYTATAKFQGETSINATSAKFKIKIV